MKGNERGMRIMRSIHILRYLCGVSCHGGQLVGDFLQGARTVLNMPPVRMHRNAELAPGRISDGEWRAPESGHGSIANIYPA